MTDRQFATEVVQTLRNAGFEALFAGGCVRDMLLGGEPEDFDVATSAEPSQVQKLFRRTIAIGASFGVIEVLGAKPLKVQVATFRSEGPYSDGRHPDRVTFTSSREDAERRDFTINGMFFDPVENRLIDYVGGEADLRDRVLRAIGDPMRRFTEDRLRMLRAVRFAARFDLTIEPTTFDAIRQMAQQVTAVSGERIAEELRKLFTGRRVSSGVESLIQSGLWAAIFPEAPAPTQASIAALDQLDDASSLPLGLALLIGELPPAQLRLIADRLRISNAERDRLLWLAARRESLKQPARLPLHELKPLLAHAGIAELLALHRALSCTDAAAYCEDRLAEWPREVLDPPPVITGDDLKDLGLTPGPRFKSILDEVRNLQLDGQITTRDAGLEMVQAILSREP